MRTGWGLARCINDAWGVRATRRRASLSRLLNGKAGVSANMALGDIGWGTAENWTRMHASYELAQARCGRDKRGEAENERGA